MDFTISEEAQALRDNVRRLVIELMLARNPRHPALLNLAAQFGIEKTRFDVEVKGCILCGQCVRTCREVVGVAAIGFEGRGTIRKVAPPFNESPADCIACGCCDPNRGQKEQHQNGNAVSFHVPSVAWMVLGVSLIPYHIMVGSVIPCS